MCQTRLSLSLAVYLTTAMEGISAKTIASVAVAALCAALVRGRSVINAAVVDYSAATGSVLLRSSGAAQLLPTPSFNQSGLVAELRAACERARVPFPKRYTLQTVSLLSFPQELPEYEVESAHFAAHPDQGSCAHWPLTGLDTPVGLQEACKRCNTSSCATGRDAFGQPRNFTAADRRSLAAAFGTLWATHEALGERAKTLRAWLVEPVAVPRVIAVHCHHGIDRTGELVAAYEMMFKNTTLTDSLRRSAALTGRGAKYCTQLAAQWECVRQRIAARAPINDCLVCDAPGTGATCHAPTLLWWCGSYNFAGEA